MAYPENPIGVGCGRDERHTPHYLRLANVGYGAVTCAGVYPPAEIVHTRSSGIITVTFADEKGSQSHEVCLYPGDQHEMELPTGNIETYVSGARLAYKQGLTGVLAASSLNVLLQD